MKDLIFNQLTVILLFAASVYLGYVAVFLMDTKTALVSLACIGLGSISKEINDRIPKKEKEKGGDE